MKFMKYLEILIKFSKKYKFEVLSPRKILPIILNVVLQNDFQKYSYYYCKTIYEESRQIF